VFCLGFCLFNFESEHFFNYVIIRPICIKKKACLKLFSITKPPNRLKLKNEYKYIDKYNYESNKNTQELIIFQANL